MSFKSLLILACIRFSLSTPVAAPISRSLYERETYTKEGLSDEFKGLYWEYAFTKDDDGNQECSEEKLDVLVPALRKTKDFMGLLADATRKDFHSDGAWHTFYIRPNPAGKQIVEQDWNYNDENKAALKNIEDNARSASHFPFNGGSGTKAQRASIRCKEALPNGDKYCDKARLPAYTTQKDGRGGTGDNTWITFCPLFFSEDIEKLDDLTKTKKKPDDLYGLRSREHILAHEFMHVDRFTPPRNKHIEDLSDDSVDGLVYGGSRCADFGWLYHKSKPSKVNVEQELNADTYGWWFTAVWFQTKFDWKYDTSSTKRPGWTDSTEIKGFDDGTRGDFGVGGDPVDETDDDGGLEHPGDTDAIFGGQSTHAGMPDPVTCPGC